MRLDEAWRPAVLGLLIIFAFYRLFFVPFVDNALKSERRRGFVESGNAAYRAGYTGSLDSETQSYYRWWNNELEDLQEASAYGKAAWMITIPFKAIGRWARGWFG